MIENINIDAIIEDIYINTQIMLPKHTMSKYEIIIEYTHLLVNTHQKHVI